MTTYNIDIEPAYQGDPLSAFLNIVETNTLDNKNARSRMRKYVGWLFERGKNVLSPEFDAYRRYLGDTLKTSSIDVHLSTIREFYRLFLESRDILFSFLPVDMSMVEKKSYVDELVTRIEIQISQSKKSGKKQEHTIQDRPDDGRRLSKESVQQLLFNPGLSTLTGIRDTAIIALFLATGCREGELVAATVKDISQTYLGNPCFHIPNGKGRKERVVPYGELIRLKDYIDLWLEVSGISSGVLFRRIYKGGKTIGKDKLSTYAIQCILRQYPVKIDEEWVIVRPHDLRRTYARLAYDSSMDIYKLQLNLGHASQKTTHNYIGQVGADQRLPTDFYGSIRSPMESMQR